MKEFIPSGQQSEQAKRINLFEKLRQELLVQDRYGEDGLATTYDVLIGQTPFLVAVTHISNPNGDSVIFTFHAHTGNIPSGALKCLTLEQDGTVRNTPVHIQTDSPIAHAALAVLDRQKNERVLFEVAPAIHAQVESTQQGRLLMERLAERTKDAAVFHQMYTVQLPLGSVTVAVHYEQHAWDATLFFHDSEKPNALMRTLHIAADGTFINGATEPPLTRPLSESETANLSTRDLDALVPPKKLELHRIPDYILGADATEQILKQMTLSNMPSIEK